MHQLIFLSSNHKPIAKKTIFLSCSEHGNCTFWSFSQSTCYLYNQSIMDIKRNMESMSSPKSTSGSKECTFGSVWKIKKIFVQSEPSLPFLLLVPNSLGSFACDGHKWIMLHCFVVFWNFRCAHQNVGNNWNKALKLFLGAGSCIFAFSSVKYTVRYWLLISC